MLILPAKMFVPSDGNTLYCPNGIGSQFGDYNDVYGKNAQDNGRSAWNVKYVDMPELLGCALPCQPGGELFARLLSGYLRPYKGKTLDGVTRIGVYSYATKQGIKGYLVDKGPAARLHRPVDLLPACVKALGLPDNDVYHLAVRIYPPGTP